MSTILVVGANGFLGGRLAEAFRAGGHTVRASVRKRTKAHALADRFDVVEADVGDLASMRRACAGIDAVYLAIHTLAPQPAAGADGDFMDAEMDGVRNVVAACLANDARRLVYVTSLGVAPDARSAWLRGRWKTERFVLASGLDATVVHPGQIVGVGGRGLDTMVAQAKQRVILDFFGGGDRPWRNIAVDDLLHYLTEMLAEPRTYGHAYDVGCDDVLTRAAMTEATADLLGRPHPLVLPVPHAVFRAFAPLIERAAKLPRGAVRGFLDCVGADNVGDPLPIRAIFPKPLLPYRDAVRRALTESERALP